MGPRLGRVEYREKRWMRMGARPSFNGATLRTRGILAEFFGLSVQTVKLQWGHA